MQRYNIPRLVFIAPHQWSSVSLHYTITQAPVALRLPSLHHPHHFQSPFITQSQWLSATFIASPQVTVSVPSLQCQHTSVSLLCTTSSGSQSSFMASHSVAHRLLRCTIPLTLNFHSLHHLLWLTVHCHCTTPSGSQSTFIVPPALGLNLPSLHYL